MKPLFDQIMQSAVVIAPAEANSSQAQRINEVSALVHKLDKQGLKMSQEQFDAMIGSGATTQPTTTPATPEIPKGT